MSSYLFFLRGTFSQCIWRPAVWTTGWCEVEPCLASSLVWGWSDKDPMSGKQNWTARHSYNRVFLPLAATLRKVTLLESTESWWKLCSREGPETLYLLFNKILPGFFYLKPIDQLVEQDCHWPPWPYRLAKVSPCQNHQDSHSGWCSAGHWSFPARRGAMRLPFGDAADVVKRWYIHDGMMAWCLNTSPLDIFLFSS